MIPNYKNVKNPISQRIIQFVWEKHLNLSTFEKKCGLSNGYVKKLKGEPSFAKLKDIINVFPELSVNWVLFGEGEMLNQTQPNKTVNQQFSTNAISNINGTITLNPPRLTPQKEEAEILIPERSPIIPASVANRPEFDVLPFLENNRSGIELADIRVGNTPITMWYRVQDNSLEPEIKIGDLVALHAYPKGKESPIFGKLYAVDTYSNGIILRILYPHENGYTTKAINDIQYPDYVINREDVIRIYKKMLIVRF